jgi:hypothetical protein
MILSNRSDLIELDAENENAQASLQESSIFSMNKLLRESNWNC